MSLTNSRALDNFTSFNMESNVTRADFATTLGPETTTVLNLTPFDVITEEIASKLHIVYTPLLIILGCIGNLMSILVFCTTKLGVQSTSHYLSALAVSDTIFLLQLIPPWLRAVEVSSVFNKNGFCQVIVYLTYVSSHHSSWLVVSFTVERLVAVVYPLKRNVMCSTKRARHIIFALAIISLVVNIPVLRFAVPSAGDCNIDYQLLDHAARFNMVDTMLSFTVPLAMIIVLNAWIMTGVYRLGRTRGHLEPPESVAQSRALNWQRSQQRVTRMLLIVSSVFVLLNLPAYTMRIVAYANNMNENEYSGKWAALQQVCLLFFNTNFGINFFLYCMSGQNFRRALCITFPWLRRLFGYVPGANLVATRATVSTSNITEGPINAGAVGPRGIVRRPRGIAAPSITTEGDNFISRWRFDNSRQRQQQIEMQTRRQTEDM